MPILTWTRVGTAIRGHDFTGLDLTWLLVICETEYSKSRFFLQFVYRRRIQPERPHAKVDPVKLELSRRASDVS